MSLNKKITVHARIRARLRHLAQYCPALRLSPADWIEIFVDPRPTECILMPALNRNDH